MEIEVDIEGKIKHELVLRRDGMMLRLRDYLR